MAISPWSETMKPDIESFRKEVFNIVSEIPRGKVLTYGQIAWLIGRPQNSRLVGRVLREASESFHLPCHRVVNSQGRLAPGFTEQRRLLESEGVVFKTNACVNMKECNFKLQ